MLTGLPLEDTQTMSGKNIQNNADLPTDRHLKACLLYTSYNYAIAEQRVFALVDHLITQVTMYREGGFDIPQLDIFSEADLVSGNIHEELTITNAVSYTHLPAPQLVELTGFEPALRLS